MQATRNAVHAIQVGDADAYLVSGVESVSQVGRTLTEDDKHPALSSADAITDVYVPMGVTAENVAERFGITREDMDAFALRSHERAVAASGLDRMRADLLTVDTPGGTVSRDDGPRTDTSLDRLATLPPAFREGGSVTAGNSCPLNDGAAAAVLVEEKLAERLGLPVRARIVASAVSGVDPALMGVGPVKAVRRLLERTGMRIDQIDVVELNEAFASQVLAVCRELGIDAETQLNPQGGAIALGHPFGMSGLRIVGAAVQDLEQRGARHAIATLCVGGGQGMAMLIERA
jgi:acetyl-CoA C-acetyltransferase